MISIDGITIDRKTKTIAHAGEFWRAAPNDKKRFDAFCYLILGGGVSRQRVFWHLYGDDPAGGPLMGSNVISVLMWQWRPVLTRLQLEVRTEKIGGVRCYEIVPVSLPIQPSQRRYTRHPSELSQ